VVFILHIVSGDTKGIDIKSGLFFKTARQCGVWHNARPATRSAVTKARKKLHWKVFESVFSSVVSLALRHWPTNAKYLWHGMSVFAIDGSKFTMPASAEIRDYFDPDCGLQNVGKGHYPQALVSTAFDVSRRIPVARTVMPNNTSERKEAMAMLARMPFTAAAGKWKPTIETKRSTWISRHSTRAVSMAFTRSCSQWPSWRSSLGR